MERDKLAHFMTAKTKISTHTLTWSVTGNILHIFGKFSNFNSHAHVERDSADFVIYCIWIISTHTLTWSVTGKISDIKQGDLISTHTLTWSVTV